MSNYIKAKPKARYTKPSLLTWIYRHPQTNKIVTSHEALNSDAVHRMGVTLIACHAVAG